jgi:hypothetical protein
MCLQHQCNLFTTDQKRSCSKSPDVISQGGYATNFGAGLGGGGSRGIEGQIIANVFKTLVTRLVKSAKELRSQENMVRPDICDHTFSCFIFCTFILSLLQIKYVK